MRYKFAKQIVLTGMTIGLTAIAILAGSVHSKPQALLAQVGGTPAGLHVQGNQLVTASGQPIRLLGVNHSGTEFECDQGSSAPYGWGIFDGPLSLTATQAIAAWHANAVRVPLNEDCWLGINNVDPAYSGAAYQTVIQQYVALLHQAGLYAILDLHWNAPGSYPAQGQEFMADADHSVAFWSSVAAAYKSDPATLFDLYNEPYFYDQSAGDPQWQCWLSGCGQSRFVNPNDPSYWTTYTWQSAGMQTLINTVRQAGATNVIMVGGIDWANDLSGWLAHRPTDPANNLAASWHSYPGQGCSASSCWNSVIVPLAQQVPVVVGETGDYVCAAPTYDPTFLPWADQHGLSYLGWTWNTWGDCDNVLISDYSGTPTANYGQYFHDHLAATSSTPTPTATLTATATPTSTTLGSTSVGTWTDSVTYTGQHRDCGRRDPKRIAAWPQLAVTWVCKKGAKPVDVRLGSRYVHNILTKLVGI